MFGLGTTEEDTNQGGSALWTPASQAGLIGWGRADSGLTIPSAANVTAWADKSPSGSNMVLAGTATADPQFIASSINGQPAVRMQTTGGNAWLTGTFGSAFAGTTITAIVVGVVTYDVAGRRLISCPNGGADTTAAGFTLYQASATTVSLYNAAVISTATTANRTGGLAGVYSIRFDGAHGTARVTGVDATPGAATPSLSFSSFDFSDVNGFDFQYDVCEWAFVSHALSAGEFALWSAYTTARYGLAS